MYIDTYRIYSNKLSCDSSLKGKNKDTEITVTITSKVIKLSLSYTDPYLLTEFSQIGWTQLVVLSIQYWTTKIISTDFILIIYIWKNQFKLNKGTYQCVTWLFSHQKIKIKYKDLVMRSKQEAASGNDIASFLVKTPLLWLGHMQAWMVTVILFLSDFVTGNLKK